jgi:hypothetical protein
VACATAAAAVLVAFYAVGFLASTPPTVQAAQAPAGQAQLTLQAVASYGHSPHPDWVSYLVRDASGKWRHTTIFKVPAHSLVHVTVYLKGVADDAKDQCSVAPCTLAQAHSTITFTFRTGKPGTFRWQCFVPCAASFIFGNGGPMQTPGWMDGYLKVV